MRILIQHPDQSRYYDGIGWDGNVERARDFGSVAKAEAFCAKQAVKGVLIVVKFNDPAQDICYPVGTQSALVVSKPPTTKIRTLS